MESPAAPSPGSGEERGLRAKFLCSFGGSILPRPLDGMLRYVGGETRIVTFPHDVTYEDLLARMREIFEGTFVIKYQQPEEDLDALVSVVNDDDVMNMMEEHEKLGASGDGFIRLRIFLFSHQPDADAAIAAAHLDADERETERRYVDALNSLTDVRSQSPPLDYTDQFFGHGLSHLNIPHPAYGQRYGEVDNSSWSPAYISPGHAHDLREYQGSPSSVRHHHLGAGEFSDQSSIQIDHYSPPVMENMVWLPPGAIIQEKSGFPSHLGYNQNAYDGNAMSEHRHMPFKRGQTPMSNSWYLDPRFQHPQHHFEQSSGCTECYHGRDPYIFNQDRIFHPHPSNMRIDDPRVHLPGSPYGYGTFYDGGEVFQAQQTDRISPIVHIDGVEDNGVCYVEDNFYQIQNNLPPLHLRRKVQTPLYPGTSNDSPGVMVPSSYQDTGKSDVQTQSPRAVRKGSSSHNLAASPSHHEHGLKGNLCSSPADVASENSCIVTNDNQPGPVYVPKDGADEIVEIPEKNESSAKLDEERSQTTNAGNCVADATIENGGNQLQILNLLLDRITSIKKMELEHVEEVKTATNGDTLDVLTVENDKEPPLNELEPGAILLDAEVESDGEGENQTFTKIESTTAESEALAKGLQTIHNDDLEEIKELGSGAFGAVYHSKWKGTDVAVKRIKASCFTGKPSERERLISDFWKEALTLSSLHHPNVVAFYGVVRDAPDGCLATVTEFMINGSLKQFLQKKDRTIDRRKRLIIAMDVAFGMEYLHGKNIVHFDLKCENLLVNMRDPHRPVCKIGDLGLSKVKQYTLVSGGVRGTLPWMAPELLSGKTSMVCEKIDVYSFGVVMWELLTGEDPYSEMHCASIIGGILNNTLRPQIPNWCDPEWKSLMESCWSSDPAQRPSFSEISQRLRKIATAANVK
ncbi:Serine/threonine-protein kinase CTR1 [Platanthera guangdongensis]|uniref:Serine/threonine-protein kinase CTR1 n=1 Tax=Platanthera guangdongensis TaxID=2320717 RepID=A0ABR2MWT5_9ASPA